MTRQLQNPFETSGKQESADAQNRPLSVEDRKPRVPSVSLVGVTGYGGQYVNHLLRLHDRGKIQLRDAVVINPGSAEAALKALAQRRIQTLPCMDALCGEAAADWICLPVGIPVHRDLTVQALETGANVLLEKPAAGCVADWKRMREARDRSGRRVMVGFQHIHCRQIQWVKRELVQGDWGAIRRIRVWGQWPRGDRYYQRNNWVGKRMVNGVAVNDSPLQNAFAHYLNLSLFLAGKSFESWAEALAVTGHLQRVRPEIETFDNCDVCFQLSTGVPLSLRLKHATRTHVDPVVRIEAERGALEIHDRKILVKRNGAAVHESICEQPHANMFGDVLVRNAFGCSLDDAGYHTRAVELVTNTLEPHPVDKPEQDPESGAWVDPSGES